MNIQRSCCSFVLTLPRSCSVTWYKSTAAGSRRARSTWRCRPEPDDGLRSEMRKGSAMSEKIAVVGAGLVGRAWAITFARAGRQVGLWDPDPAAAVAAIATIPQLLANLETEGLLKGVSAAEVGQRIASP